MSEQFYTDTRPEIHQWDTVTIGKAKTEWTVALKSASGTIFLERQNSNTRRYISRRTISWNDTDTVLTVVYCPFVEEVVEDEAPVEAPKTPTDGFFVGQSVQKGTSPTVYKVIVVTKTAVRLEAKSGHTFKVSDDELSDLVKYYPIAR